jgi:cyclic beta-1,2-glucan synthetase
MINPVSHGATPTEIASTRSSPTWSRRRLRVSPHVGRGGWSWYTGSAGWMYRLLVDAKLSAKLQYVDGDYNDPATFDA